MIELKQFVTATLVQIIEGVKDAQQAATDAGGKINPLSQRHGADVLRSMSVGSDNNISRVVEFDVAITSAEGSSTGAGIKVFLAGIGAGAGGKSDKQTSSVTRIKFPVPVFLPGRR